MTNEEYRLRLRPGAEEESGGGDVRERLLRIPGVSEQGEDLFHFGQPDADGVMAIRLGESDIDMTIPRPWIHERGPQVFALVFMVAEWRGWEVFDPQIGETLQKEAVLQGLVAMRQAQRNVEEAGADPGAVRSEPPGRPEGVKADPTDDLQAYRPTTSAPPSGKSEEKKPWWKKLTGG